MSGFIAEVALALSAQPPCGLTFADDATGWIAGLPRYPVHVTDWPTDGQLAFLVEGFGFSPVSHPDVACGFGPGLRRSRHRDDFQARIFALGQTYETRFDCRLRHLLVAPSFSKYRTRLDRTSRLSCRPISGQSWARRHRARPRSAPRMFCSLIPPCLSSMATQRRSSREHPGRASGRPPL